MSPALKAARDEASRTVVLDALQSNPSIRAAAASLDITPPALAKLMRRLGIAVQPSRTLNIVAP